jgi:hypothetical protein
MTELGSDKLTAGYCLFVPKTSSFYWRGVSGGGRQGVDEHLLREGWKHMPRGVTMVTLRG